MPPLRHRLVVLKAALWEGFRISALLFLIYCVPFLGAVGLIQVAGGDRAARGSGDLAGYVLPFLLLGMPIFGGFLVAAPVISVLCLLGVPMGTAVEQLKGLARFPRKASPPPTPRGVYDRSLDG